MQSNKPKGWSHQRLKSRRSTIAEFVKDNDGDTRKAARHFGVSVQTVRNACWEAGVHLRPRRQLKALKVLAAINHMKEGESITMMAKRIGVTRQYAYAIFHEAQQLGLLAGEWRTQPLSGVRKEKRNLKKSGSTT